MRHRENTRRKTTVEKNEKKTKKKRIEVDEKVQENIIYLLIRRMRNKYVIEKKKKTENETTKEFIEILYLSRNLCISQNDKNVNPTIINMINELRGKEHSTDQTEGVSNSSVKEQPYMKEVQNADNDSHLIKEQV